MCFPIFFWNFLIPPTNILFTYLFIRTTHYFSPETRTKTSRFIFRRKLLSFKLSLKLLIHHLLSLILHDLPCFSNAFNKPLLIYFRLSKILFSIFFNAKQINRRDTWTTKQKAVRIRNRGRDIAFSRSSCQQGCRAVVAVVAVVAVGYRARNFYPALNRSRGQKHAGFRKM